MLFDPYAPAFRCPRCEGTCNCTSCCAKRNELYVSSRGHKLDIPIFDIYAYAPLNRKTHNTSMPKPTRPSLSAKTATPVALSLRSKLKPPPKLEAILKLSKAEHHISAAMARPQGTVEGAVYSPSVYRSGISVVADSLSHPTSQKQRAGLIGRPLSHWVLLPDMLEGMGAKPGQRVFVGKKEAVVEYHHTRGLDVEH